jgi:hypothetical protein
MSGVDGHPLFCTYIDVYPYGVQPPFATDPAGSAYFAGECVADPHQGCVEKLNPKGDSIGYLTQPESWTAEYLAVDSNGNVGIATFPLKIPYASSLFSWERRMASC